MGSRANIVLVQDGTYSLRYCHWCAQTLPVDLFWGPEYAILLARQFPDARTLGPGVPMRRPDLSSPSQVKPRPPGTEGWLDDRYSEGGAVIDLDRQVLLLYGGDDISTDVPLRRLYLELLQTMWPGWEIRWAHLGILDLADYVGLPRHVVMTHPRDDVMPLRLDCRRAATIGSILFRDQTWQLYPLFGVVFDFLRAGPRLVDSAQEEQGYTFMPLAEWDSWLPQGGFHIDVGQRLVEVWAARTLNKDPETHIAALWPDWRFHWLQDRYEEHLMRLGDRIQWPSPGTDRLMSWLESMLMSESNAPLALLCKVIEERKQAGYIVDVSEKILSEHPSVVPRELRRQILDQALSAWRKG